jgi:cell division protein FtsI (penicillin-binding protein 3)
MNVKQSIILRAKVAFVIVAVFAGFVIAQAVQLTVVERETYQELSRKQTIRLQEVLAVRGNIMSSDGRLLATSMPKYTIFFDTRAPGITETVFKKSVDSLSLMLSMTFPSRTKSMWKEYLEKGRKNSNRYLFIQKDVTYEKARDMGEWWPIFRLGRYSGGLIREEKNVREMPFGDMARRTVGFTAPNGRTVGLEHAFDSLLRGVSGERLEQKVSAKVWRPIDNQGFSPQNGCDIVTTLDLNIQDVAEDALKRALQQSDAKSGCAILMEVKTGAIKAIANFSRTPKGTYFEDFNIALGIASDPGSTFKLASTMALLEEKAVKPDDIIHINGGSMPFYDKVMVDATIHTKNDITFKEAFEKSSNVAIAKLVHDHFKSNPQKFMEYLSLLNLDRPLGVEIPEEGNIRIKRPTDNDWYQTTLPWLSIGYESRITALQTLTMFNAIANNGTLIRPYFVDRVQRMGKVLWKHQVDVIHPAVCSKETLKTLQSLLEGVVENGTAKNVKRPDYKVAGKTGTAQILVGTQYDKGQHKASFVGYFPADNPRYSCIVVVNSPQGGLYYGGQIAGPVFIEIADKVYAALRDLHPEVQQIPNPPMPIVKNGLHSDIKSVLNTLGVSSYTINHQAPIDWVSAHKGPQHIRLQPLKIQQERLPDVSGMGLRDALYLLEHLGLQAQVLGYGAVVRTQPPPGTPIKRGQTITLVLKP